jgi:hypothetical protein
LFTLTVMHLWPVAGPERLPQSVDLMLQYIPNLAHLARGLDSGIVPLWNPWQGAGLPFAANPGTGAWYPLSWLLLWALPLWDAVRATLWIHVVIAVVGTWRCLRGPLRASHRGALVGTAAFALSPWLPGLTGMAAVMTSIAWLPWVVDAGLRLRHPTRRMTRTVAMLALATAAQFASGWPIGAYLSWMLLVAATVLLATSADPKQEATHGASSEVWTALRGSWGRRFVVPFGAQIAAGVLAATIAAIVLVPAAEFIAQTTYAGTRPVERVATDGYLTLLSWLRPAAGAGALEGGQVTVGVAALVLVAISPILLRHSPQGRAALRSWGVIAVVSVVLTWGTRTPAFEFLYTWLPGFRIVYLPARLGIVASFAIACLAAAVVDHLATPTSHAAGGLPSVRHASVRDARLAWATASSLPILTLAQFWFAEGYDNGRRLLTNLWRFSGGPFLSVTQELHAATFGVATVAVVVAAIGAVGRRRSALATVLTATVIADLGTLAVLSAGPSFNPVAWYAPALASAMAVRDAIDHDRFAGLPWHVSENGSSPVRHFLGDFPDSVRPAMLPPNLGLLVGVRDTQAYDPLILRVTARAFSAGAPGGDDHWALLAVHDPQRTRPLAVREVLAAGEAAWRVPTLPLGATIARCCDPVVAWRGHSAPVEWENLHVVAFLGESTDITHETTVAEVSLTTGVGTFVTALRAGIDVSEWAYDRPDVRSRVAHAQAPASLVTRVVGAVGGRYDTFEYRSTIPNDTRSPLTAIAIRVTVPSVTVHLVNLAVDLPQSPWQRSALGWRDASPDASRLRVDPPDAGIATWMTDDPDHLRIAATLTKPARVVIADTPYPGWVATIDGIPVPVTEADGALARVVEVPAGSHVVEYRFNPTSITFGRVVSIIGLAVAAGLLFVGQAPTPGLERASA